MGPIEQIKALQEVFGGGVLGGAVGVVLLAFVTLFFLFVRSKNAHLETALKLAPIADQMNDVLAKAVEELKEAREILQMHRPRKQRGGRALPPEAPTVILRPGEEEKD